MATKKDSTYPLRLRKDEDPRVVEFLNSQSGGYGDVIRYLIEKEIALNGIRDLSTIVPARRNIDALAATLENSFNNNTTRTIEKKEVAVTREKDNVSINEVEIPIDEEVPVDEEVKERILKTLSKANEDEVNEEIDEVNEEIDEVNEENIYKEIVENNKNEVEENQDMDDDYIPDCYK